MIQLWILQFWKSWQKRAFKSKVWKTQYENLWEKQDTILKDCIQDIKLTIGEI